MSNKCIDPFLKSSSPWNNLRYKLAHKSRRSNSNNNRQAPVSSHWSKRSFSWALCRASPTEDWAMRGPICSYLMLACTVIGHDHFMAISSCMPLSFQLVCRLQSPLDAMHAPLLLAFWCGLGWVQSCDSVALSVSLLTLWVIVCITACRGHGLYLSSSEAVSLCGQGRKGWCINVLHFTTFWPVIIIWVNCIESAHSMFKVLWKNKL